MKIKMTMLCALIAIVLALVGRITYIYGFQAGLQLGALETQSIIDHLNAQEEIEDSNIDVD